MKISVRGKIRISFAQEKPIKGRGRNESRGGRENKKKTEEEESEIEKILREK
jgi:hypothetical protein